MYKSQILFGELNFSVKYSVGYYFSVGPVYVAYLLKSVTRSSFILLAMSVYFCLDSNPFTNALMVLL